MTAQVMAASRWRAAAQAHADRADRLTAEHRRRRARSQRHPVWDFLFDYYPLPPGRLRRWSPGPGILLADAELGGLLTRELAADEAGRFYVDTHSLWQRRGDTYRFILNLLEATAGREGNFSCFGLHEWAMVYRTDHPRHPEPLRLGTEGTDAVVEAHELRCSHYDAFRFFTEAAAPRNRLHPTRTRQRDLERPSCLHANMDLYKWAIKLGPLVPGELLLDCFELARELRRLDMEASPYDLRAWGMPVLAVETAEGKAEYVRRQRELSDRAAPLRERLAAVIRQSAPVHLS